MSRRALVLTATLILLAPIGCATQQRRPARPERATYDYTHTDGEATEVVNSKVVDQPFDETWNELVRNVTTTQFAITNVDKESRILTLNYGGETLATETYVDCGESTHRIAYNGRTWEFRYLTAASSYSENVFTDAYNRHYWVKVNRAISMDAKINVYIAPVSDTQTEITVNARIRLSGCFKGNTYSYRKNGQYLIERPLNDDVPEIATILTRQPSTRFGNQDVRCQSTGVLERSLLDQVG